MIPDRFLDAQYSVLGSVLISPEIVPKVIRETSEEDYTGPCLTVYKAVKALFLAGTPVDPVSLVAKLGDEYRKFLVELMEVTPTAANIDSYLALARANARTAALRELGRQMTEEPDLERLRDLLSKANGLTVDRPGLKIVTMDDALKSFFDRKSRETVYLTWPVKELNDRIYAEPGDFIVLGGRPSTGKSSWALQCAWHWAGRYKVGFFSLETSSEKLFDRQMAALSGIPMAAIKRSQIGDDDWARVACLTQEVTSRKLEIVPAAGMSAADIRAVTMMQGYEIIVVDYLQLIAARGDNRTNQVTDISIALHTMAQSLRVMVVALSQLSRQDPSKGKAAPELSSLRESGQIEQDADVVMLLSMAKDGDDRELWIRKNKEGTCPQIRLAFDGDHQTFSKAPGGGGTQFARKKPQRTPVLAESQPMEQMTLLPDDTEVPF